MGIDLNSPSVQSYLGIHLGVINRMAANSGACKGWCTDLVSAIMAVIVDKKWPDSVPVAPLPVCVFLVTCNLTLQSRFRRVFVHFVKCVRDGFAKNERAFAIASSFDCRTTIFDALQGSASTTVSPFYVLTILMISIVRFVAN